MLKTKIVMNEAIVSSNYTPEDFAKLRKFAPEALSVLDKDGDEVFSYAYQEGAVDKWPVSKYGIMFNAVDNSGKAAVVVQLPQNLGDETAKKQWVAENLGAALQFGSQLEEGFSAKIEEIDNAIDTIVNDIEIAI